MPCSAPRIREVRLGVVRRGAGGVSEVPRVREGQVLGSRFAPFIC